MKNAIHHKVSSKSKKVSSKSRLAQISEGFGIAIGIGMTGLLVGCVTRPAYDTPIQAMQNPTLYNNYLQPQTGLQLQTNLQPQTNANVQSSLRFYAPQPAPVQLAHTQTAQSQTPIQQAPMQQAPIQTVAPIAQGAQNLRYEVRTGDTLASIGARFGIDSVALANLNRTTSVQAGQWIVVPIAVPTVQAMPISTQVTPTLVQPVAPMQALPQALSQSTPQMQFSQAQPPQPQVQPAPLPSTSVNASTRHTRPSNAQVMIKFNPPTYQGVVFEQGPVINPLAGQVLQITHKNGLHDVLIKHADGLSSAFVGLSSIVVAQHENVPQAGAIGIGQKGFEYRLIRNAAHIDPEPFW